MSKFDESNIAAFGGEEDHAARLEKAKKTVAYRGAGKKVGLQVWRIKDFEVEVWPKERIGEFYSGDSYIVLNTYKSSPESRALAYDLHFWIGESSTQDEYGAAAYKTVELDDLLGGKPVQHREVQGHESMLFLSLFHPPMRILMGGAESGFTKVGPKKYVSRLLMVKGRKAVKLSQCAECSASQLNQGDVFILDAGLSVWAWEGESANPFEKRKAQQAGKALAHERGTKCKFMTVDAEGDDAFWAALGGKGDVAPASAAGDDKESEQAAASMLKLLKVSDAKGKLKISVAGDAKKGVSKSKLKSNDVFILLTGLEVYVWVGKKASAQEKDQAIPIAARVMKKEGLHPYLPISKVSEGAESSLFFSHFSA